VLMSGFGLAFQLRYRLCERKPEPLERRIEMENLNTKDRLFRTLVGAALVASIVSMSVDATTIVAMSLASFYPLLTALLAWDPVYAILLSAGAAVYKTFAPMRIVKTK